MAPSRRAPPPPRPSFFSWPHGLYYISLPLFISLSLPNISLLICYLPTIEYNSMRTGSFASGSSISKTVAGAGCRWLPPITLPTWETETDREDPGSRPAWENSLQNPISKITWAKWTGELEVWLKSSGVPALQLQSPEFKPWSQKKKKTVLSI
jgi:hypothetical protein